MKQIRELVLYRHYFRFFYDEQEFKVKEKIDFVLFLVTHAERIPVKFLKHVESQRGLYELRIEVGNNIYRIFCCFDKGRVVALFNAFNKKTQKTPVNEIALAVKLMKEYFTESNIK